MQAQGLAHYVMIIIMLKVINLVTALYTLNVIFEELQLELIPIDIPIKLDVGTSALRHYEAWGIVPAAKRKANGYRIYTEEHQAYFQCIRAMYHGFGMATVRKIMPFIQKHQFTEALWHVNKVQADL